MKRAQLLKIMAQLSSIWAKGRILMTVYVLSELKVMVYYYFVYHWLACYVWAEIGGYAKFGENKSENSKWKVGARQTSI